MIASREALPTAEQRWPNSPSEREMEIYAAVRVNGRRQADVAAEFGITQGRVSQIVRRVNHWRAGMGIGAEFERRDRKSVDRWLEQLRIEKLYEETMELYRRSCQPRRKERKGKDRHGEWTTESIDHQPGNLQCLKLAARLIELRRQLDEDPPRPDQSADSPRSRIDDEGFRLLVDMRSDAIRRGDVPQGESPDYTVQQMMDELIGRKPHVSPWEQAAAEARQSEVNAAAAYLVEPCDPAANAPPIISNISGATAAVADEQVVATDAMPQIYGADSVRERSAAEANNSEFFAGSAYQAEPDHPHDACPPIEVPSVRRDLPIDEVAPFYLRGDQGGTAPAVFEVGAECDSDGAASGGSRPPLASISLRAMVSSRGA
jgi:hypothetical protein